MKISDDLRFYVDMAHELTFNIESEFKDIYHYNNRLIKFMSEYQSKVKALRKSFLIDYHNSKEFQREYHDYMEEELDYILFVNLNVSAVDPRKFSKKWYKKYILKSNDKNLTFKERRKLMKKRQKKKPLVRFVAYWYQVLLWEIYIRYSVAYWKSRDVGLSFSIIAGEVMGLMHKEGAETIFMSRIEKDVDMTDDRTQTNMGRARKMIEDTVIYNLNNMYKDKYLVLYGEETAGIKGANVAQAGRQGRFERGMDDEAGAQPRVQNVVEAVTMATTTVMFAGTLKPATDAGFRKIINSGRRIQSSELRQLFDNFKKNIKSGLTYSESWDAVFDNVDYEEGQLLSFTNTFEDHPLKTGNCDYFRIESNRLLNDDVVIAHELKADLNAGSPDRSFYSLTKQHHEKIDVDDFKYFDVIMGFDPGSHGTTAMIPIIIDHFGFCYILPAEIFNKGSMLEWIDKLIMKYGRFVIYAEESVKAYSRAGAGWLSVLRNRDIRTVIVSNRHPEDQILVVNEVFRRKILDEYGDERYKVTVDEANEWFTMSYISGMKYNDAEQRKMSHAAEAMIAPIFHLNKEILDGVKYGISYG